MVARVTIRITTAPFGGLTTTRGSLGSTARRCTSFGGGEVLLVANQLTDRPSLTRCLLGRPREQTLLVKVTYRLDLS